ncbi:TldD/PmbA family protein [Thioalkalivibrio sp.]|uniref:TldD/PmbA family protein n=1 Tax=Thioalkalivibrio sp. TaxID=2093813 RepID=UPI00356A2019
MIFSTPIALEDFARRFRERVPAVDDWSLRIADVVSETLSVRRDVVEPVQLARDTGAMITVSEGGALGYAATSDLSRSGLAQATERAREWALRAAPLRLFPPPALGPSGIRDEWQAPVLQPWTEMDTPAKLRLLQELARRMKIHDDIVDWSASLGFQRRQTLLVNAQGAEIGQTQHVLVPMLRAVANRGGETQIRSFGADLGGQGGLERLDTLALAAQPERVAGDALALLDAAECPAGIMDLVLMPGQMTLQIHESIGHPLELDRILGDERNYAGTSFVTPAMFGTYRYGSELLNVTFDPGVAGELASFAYDDEGTRARRHWLIRDGLLLRGLGGATSQDRSGLPGVACARASSWNRPPIDRMANLNLEPGHSSLDELIRGVEHGVLMDTNRSWSIDDSRNKFQFGCELGWRIVEGEVRGLVRNPGYRGISSAFWRSLAAVGDRDSLGVMGVGTCGKGEPNQMIAVGHASPPCLFRDVAVFGGSGS